MNKSESIKNIAMALCKFQAEVENPKKTADNPFFKSKYTPLEDIVSAVKPKMGEHGLSYMQSCSGDGTNIIVTTLLMHSSGEWIESDPLVLRADKATAQGAGSAITYARRYALSAVLGIASEEDDDGNHATGNSKNESKNLSEAQVKRLWAIAKSHKVTSEQVKKAIMKDYGKTEAATLTKKEYDELCNRLEKAGA